MVIIVINVRKTQENEVSVLFRILTNYAQLITSTLSFSTQYPTSLTEVLLPIKNIGDSSETFLSFDWFITDYEIKGPFPSNSFFKLFLMLFLPLILFFFVSLLMITYAYFSKTNNTKRYLAISFISIIFLLHPKLTQESLSIFRWVDIDKGVSKVRINTDMEWYSAEHLKWCVLLGAPILIIWVTVLPLTALVMMYRNVRKKGENKVKQYFLILYQGIKIDYFYWEFINSGRKILILMSFLLPSTFGIIVSIFLLIIVWRFQNHLKPYKEAKNNYIEMFGINVAIITLICGHIYNQDYETNTEILDSILLFIMLILNIIFIILWLGLLIISLGEKYTFLAKVIYLTIPNIGCEVNPNGMIFII